MKNNEIVNSMVEEIKMGLNCSQRDRKLVKVNGKSVTKLYIGCDGLYDVDGELVQKFEYTYPEDCRSAAVKALKEMVSYYTTEFHLCLFPVRKNAPIIVME